MKRPNTKRTRSTPLALLEPHASVIAKRVEPVADEMPVFAWDARPNCDDPALLALTPDTRIIVRQQGGFNVELSANLYIAELAVRRANQEKGIYTVWEAAKLLNTTIDDIPEKWQKKLYGIRINGRSIVRHTSEEIKAINAYPREHIDIVYAEDINAWFLEQGWKRRFPELTTCKNEPEPRATVPEAATGLECKSSTHSDSSVKNAAIAVTAPPLPKQRAQENRILELLELKGYSPKSLPQRVPGKPGPKSGTRKQALAEPKMFPSAKTFDTAWQRLRDGFLIDEAK